MKKKKVTTFSVMLRRVHSDFASCWDAFTSFLCARDGLYNLFSIVFLLYFFTVFPINIFINILRFFMDSCNPNFDARKEYYDLHTCSMVHGGGLAMDFSTFCNYGYDKPREKVIKELQKLLRANNNSMQGIILRDKMSPDSTAKLIYDSIDGYKWYCVSFGNEINKDLFCLFQEFISFKKEGKTTYLSFDKRRKELMEQQLSNLFNFNVRILLT